MSNMQAAGLGSPAADACKPHGKPCALTEFILRFHCTRTKSVSSLVQSRLQSSPVQSNQAVAHMNDDTRTGRIIGIITYHYSISLGPLSSWPSCIMASAQGAERGICRSNGEAIQANDLAHPCLCRLIGQARFDWRAKSASIDRCRYRVMFIIHRIMI